MRAYFFWKSSNKAVTFGFAFRPTAASKFFEPRDRRFRTFVTLTVSLLLHALILWLLLRYVLLSQGGPSGSTDTTLNVTLSSPPKAAAAAAPPTPVAPPDTEPTPPRPQPVEVRPRRNILTAPGSKTQIPQQSSLPPPPTPQPNQTAQPDLSSMIAAKQAARSAQNASEEAAAAGTPSESDDDRARRIIASNIASAKGKEYQPGDGGVFEIRDRSLHSASLVFNGWDANVGRKFPRAFPITQGSSRTLDDAIIDKVIEIIRETHPTEFQWDSRRLGKTVTRSARKEDSADLRVFLAAEFAYDDQLQERDRDSPPPPSRRRGG